MSVCHCLFMCWWERELIELCLQFLTQRIDCQYLSGGSFTCLEPNALENTTRREQDRQATQWVLFRPMLMGGSCPSHPDSRGAEDG